jgi:hypothetical protein
MVYLINNRKGSYSGSALGWAFRQWCDEAGLPAAATMHGLRKAWCRRAAAGNREMLAEQGIAAAARGANAERRRNTRQEAV